MDNTENLDDFQKYQVDRIVERKIEEQPGFEWSLVGAQLFSTEKPQHQNLPSEERRLEDYLDVSIRGMAHDFANLSNYYQFERLIRDRHLNKNYLVQLAAGRPRLDKGDGFDLAQLHLLEKKVLEEEIDETELVDIDVVENELPQTDIPQGEYSESGVVKTTAQLSKTHEERDLLYGFAKGLDANAPGDSVVPTGSRKNHQSRVSGEGESIPLFHVLDKNDPFSIDIAGERDALLETRHQPSLAMPAEDRASPLRNPRLTSESILVPGEINPSPTPRSIKQKQSLSTPASRISRSISFALRGLAPLSRAVASTEINIRNVQAEPSANPVTSGWALTDVSNELKSPSLIDSNHKTRPSVESESSAPSDYGQARTDSTPSRPIKISTSRVKVQDEHSYQW